MGDCDDFSNSCFSNIFFGSFSLEPMQELKSQIHTLFLEGGRDGVFSRFAGECS